MPRAETGRRHAAIGEAHPARPPARLDARPRSRYVARSLVAVLALAGVIIFTDSTHTTGVRVAQTL
jgi:hypothetical protein